MRKKVNDHQLLKVFRQQSTTAFSGCSHRNFNASPAGLRPVSIGLIDELSWGDAIKNGS
jgi:hypothetical protein